MGKSNKKKTQEEYVAELAVKNPNVEVVGTYINANTKITHRCIKHDVCWETTPSRALCGVGCPECKKEKHYASVAKTQEQYLEEVENRNPKVEVVGKYITANTPIRHRCKKCNYEWDVIPSEILGGSGCPKCAGNMKKTTEEYKFELSQVGSGVQVLEEYVNSQTPILHRCKCGNEWKISPTSALRGSLCPKCGREQTTAKLVKTNVQYMLELAKINEDIIAMEPYINSITPILHECKKCGLQWAARPANILNGRGCPDCANKKIGDKNRWTQEQYVDELKKKNPTVEVAAQYMGRQQKITRHCLIHDVFWGTSPASVLQGCGCKLCAAERLSTAKTWTHEQYLDIIKEKGEIVVLEQYAGNDIPILHQCTICGWKWVITPHNLLRGNGCPKCNVSKGENRAHKWLTVHGVKSESQKRFDDCRDKNPLPFDFYLPELNTAIEYDGEQHFQAVDIFGGEAGLEYTKRHDQIKTKYCEDNGINLLRIPYFKNVEEELDNFIHSAQ